MNEIGPRFIQVVRNVDFFGQPATIKNNTSDKNIKLY